MAHSLSAKKRIRQNIKRRAINRWRKRYMRTNIKEYLETIMHGSVEQAQQQLSALSKLLDRTAAAGTIHKNTAARYKARLAAKLNEKKQEKAA